MTAGALIVLTLALLAGAAPAAAHTTGTGLASVTVSGPTLTYRLTVLPSEVSEKAARLLTHAPDGDATSVETLTAELRRRITIRSSDAPRPPGRALIQGSRTSDGRVVLELTLTCPGTPARLSIRDDWADVFGEHDRTVARIALSIVWVGLENLLRNNPPPNGGESASSSASCTASVLPSAIEPLALPAGRLAVAVLGFNLGVEAAQAVS